MAALRLQADPLGTRFLEVVTGGPLAVVVGRERVEVDRDTDLVLFRRVVEALA